MSRSWNLRLPLLASLAFALVAPATASAQQQQKPNILFILADNTATRSATSERCTRG